MANTIVKRQYTKLLNSNNDLEIEHFETDADVVLVDKSSGHYGGSATNAQAAFEELYNRNEVGYIELSSTSGTLTDAQYAECLKTMAIIKYGNNLYIKDYAQTGSMYFKYIGVTDGVIYGEACHNIQVYNILIDTSTKTWTCSEPNYTFFDTEQTNTLLSYKQNTIPTSSATIASESNGIVTIKTGVSQNFGAISNSSGSDITLGASAKKGVATTISSSSTDSDLATAKAVYDAIDAIPEPMVFKGTLGTGGTVTTLPTANALSEGYTYKVITAETYASTSAKVGDVFVCAKPQGASSYSWILIPSGDDVEDTWREIQVNGTSKYTSGITSGAVNFKNGTGITASYEDGAGNNRGIKYSLADGYGDTKNPYASKTKNYVLAAPHSSDGTPNFRALVAADIPDLSADYQPKDADLTAIAGLTGTSGILKKTAANTWALDTNSYITGNQTITVSGDATGSGTTSIALTLADSGVTAGTYTAVTVNAKGLVTAGAQTIEFGTSGQTNPSASLAVGGIFLKMI